MSATWPIWLLAVLLPAITLLGQNMCVWPTPRFLARGSDAALGFGLHGLSLPRRPPCLGLLHRDQFHLPEHGGKLVSASLALSCLCFMPLWILAVKKARSLRHQAFVRASRVGDCIVQARTLPESHERISRQPRPTPARLLGRGPIHWYDRISQNSGTSRIAMTFRPTPARTNCGSIARPDRSTSTDSSTGPPRHIPIGSRTS